MDAQLVKEKIDHHLKVLNDDYVVERRHALKDVFVTILPTDTFYGWMAKRGKLGGQNKFPRVLKKNLIADWQEYLENQPLVQS